MKADSVKTLEMSSREDLAAEIMSLRERNEELTRLADAIPHIVWTMARDGSPTYFNAKWTEHSGLDLARTVEIGAATFVHPDDLPLFEAELRAAASKPSAFECTYRLRRASDDTYCWHAARVVPLLSPEGEVTSWVATATNIHEQRTKDDERRYLVAVSKVLGTSLDLRQTLSDVAKLLVPHMADWCAIDLLTESGILDRHAVAHVDPSKVALAWDLWKKSPPSPTDEHGAYAVVRSAKPEVLHLTDEVLASLVHDPESLALVRGLGLRSSLMVPLAARDRVIGVLTLVTSETAKSYDEADLTFASDLAQRVAVAVDNARLYGAAEQARAAAEALAADVVEQSRTVESALVAMRAERDTALKAASTAKLSGSTEAEPDA